jgi:hypothetical protein
VQGSLYALRTVVLPFIWIFNPQLLLIDIDDPFDFVAVVVAATLAMLAFAAITLRWLRVRMNWWEIALMALACVLLFRPDLFMDRIADEYREVPAKQIYDVAANLPDNGRLVLVIKGTTIEGDDVRKTVATRLGPAGADGRKRLADSGLTITQLGDNVQIGAVKFGSRARKAGINEGFDIDAVKVRTDRPSAHWFYLPGILLLVFVWWNQTRRLRSAVREQHREAHGPA